MSKKCGLSSIVIFMTCAFIVVVLFIAFYVGSMRWLDRQPWIAYPQNKLIIKILPSIYLRGPFSSNEDDVRRTIKLAHLIAISEIDRKSLDLMLIDLHKAQELIKVFSIRKAGELGSVESHELMLERLVLLNRMNAIALQGERRISTEIESVRNVVKGFVRDVKNIETRRALEKELNLYNIGWQESRLKVNSHLSGIFDAVDMYHYGLARCAVADDTGAPLIESSLEMIPRNNLIEIALRNVDHPLIAVAGVRQDSECAISAKIIMEKMRRYEKSEENQVDLI